MAQVKEIVQNRELYSVEPQLTVAQVARRMSELKVGAILVIGSGELLGVFSERDLMRRVVVEGRDPERTLVSDVMSRDLHTLDESATTEEAMQRMHDCGCRHLPIVRDGQPVGFLSMRDLMERELKHKIEELDHMRAYIHGVA